MNDVTAWLWSGCKLLLCASLFTVLLTSTLAVVITSVKYLIYKTKENKKNENP